MIEIKVIFALILSYIIVGCFVASWYQRKYGHFSLLNYLVIMILWVPLSTFGILLGLHEKYFGKREDQD